MKINAVNFNLKCNLIWVKSGAFNKWFHDSSQRLFKRKVVKCIGSTHVVGWLVGWFVYLGCHLGKRN